MAGPAVRRILMVHVTGRSFATFNPKKVLLLEKTTRLKYEVMSHPSLSQEQLRAELINRGSDYEGLSYRHQVHSDHVEQLTNVLKDMGIEYHVSKREDYSKDLIDWCDAIIAAGGDGTFLYAAGLHTLDCSKPVIGINSDPERSEGMLCVKSKDPSNTYNIPYLMKQLFEGNFEWTHRCRIRVKLNSKLLCYRALNEVFIGEKNPTQATYYELIVDDNEKEKQKSSGLIVYTGSGSSAWVYNINKLVPHQVEQLLNLANKEIENGIRDLESLTKKVTEAYNSQLVFEGSEMVMAFTVREVIHKGIFSASKTFGRAKRLTVRSRCFDALIALDGQKSYNFPEGSLAELSIHPEDVIKTVTFVD